MATEQIYIDANSIKVGAPMPFSVYTADRKLLLARGRVVESERMRDSLIRSGRYQSNGCDIELWLPDADTEVVPDAKSSSAAGSEAPLDSYVREFSGTTGQSRIGVRVSRDETSESFPCWVLGADVTHGLVITAPARADRSLMAISEGETWVFRLLYMTAVCKFSSTVRKVYFDPVPALSVALPRQVELRHVRTSPRVSSCLRGTVNVGKEISVLVSDIGVGGVRLAVERSLLELKIGQQVPVSFSIPMLGVDYAFNVSATIVSAHTELESRYPGLQFVGARIDALSETQRLVMHSYVFERAATDCNALWKVLTANAG